MPVGVKSHIIDAARMALQLLSTPSAMLVVKFDDKRKNTGCATLIRPTGFLQSIEFTFFCMPDKALRRIRHQ